MANNLAAMACVVFLMGFVGQAHAEMDLSIDDRARLGEVYSLERLRQFSQAKPMIETLHQRYANNHEVDWTYVRVLGFGGHWKEATSAFDQLCSVSKCDDKMYATYAHILESQGPNPEVLPYIKKLSEKYPDSKEIQTVYAEILTWNVESPKGHQAVADLSTQYPQDLKLIEAAGDLAYRDKNFTLAQKDYEQVLAKSPSTALSKKYAYALIGLKQYAQAIAQMDKLIADNPNDKDLRYQHAQVLSAAGEHRQAVQELRALLNNGYKNKEAYIMLGDQLRLLGMDQEALKVYGEVVNEK
jgi:predicted Zn-dependent protease